MYSSKAQKTEKNIAGLFLICLGLPYFWTQNVNVMPAFYNEVIAFVVWGFGLAVFLYAYPLSRNFFYKTTPVILPAIAILVLQMAVLVTQYISGKSIHYFGPVGMALLTLLGGLLCLVVGARIQNASQDRTVVANLLQWVPFVVIGIGVVQMLFGWLQYLALSDQLPFVSKLSISGRVYGNLRQPNHYALLMVVSIACMLWMADSLSKHASRGRCLLLGFAALSIAVVALSASRTGFVLLCCMAIWGIFEYRFSRRRAILLICAPIVYMAFRLLFTLLSQHDIFVYYGAGREASLDQSTNMDRLAIWNTAIHLVSDFPLTGIGYKRFAQLAFMNGNAFELTLHLENAHNLFLQWALDFGLPIALVLGSLLAYCFYKCAPLVRTTSGRVILFSLFAPLLHHMVEYPLDYAYFFFPWSLLMGWALMKAGAVPGVNAISDQQVHPSATTQCANPSNDKSRGEKNLNAWICAPLILVVGSLFAAYDIKKILPLYDVTTSAIPSERLTKAYNTVLFSYFADYSALGIVPPSPEHAATQLRLAKRVSYFRFDDFVASVYARSAALSGENCLAKAVAYRIMLADKKAFAELKAVVEKSNFMQMNSLKMFTQNPFSVAWPKDKMDDCR
jgi:O-antigen ligase